MKREFLQLAQTYDPKKHGIAGWYISEKLDGIRCFWDGGVSRGVPKAQVPWANNTNDERYSTPHISTGLWTRYGNVIHAPNWFLDSIPKVPLDGEMYSTELTRQEINGITSKLIPVDSEWKQLQYNVFDAVPFETIFADGLIKSQHFFKVIDYECRDFITARLAGLTWVPKEATPRWSTQQVLESDILKWSDYCVLHAQVRLPYATDEAYQCLEDTLEIIVANGGEGIIVRNPDRRYMCERAHHILKVKKRDDAEGTVIGYTTGRIGKEGRLLGMMGNLILSLEDGKVLELSGFKESERILTMVYADDLPNDIAGRIWANENPDTQCPDNIRNLMFPRGSIVTFKYRGRTKDGIPNEASYWRQRNDDR